MGECQSNYSWETQILKKQAIRTINKAGFNSDTDPLFHSSQILKLGDLYQYSSAMFMHNYINNLPCSFDNIFSLNKDIQTSPINSHCIHYFKYGANRQTLLQVSLLGPNSKGTSSHHLFFAIQQTFEQMLS